LSQDTVATQAESISNGSVAVTSADGEDAAFASLGATLAEIRKLKGVVGYIMRGSTSAMLDLPEGGEISQYAFLSHQLNESSFEIAKQLGITQVESVLVEGKKLKVIFVKKGENNISVFMEKSANHLSIIKRILI